MKRIAGPMVGGLISSTVLTLVIIPVVYDIWKRWELGAGLIHGPSSDAAAEEERR